MHLWCGSPMPRRRDGPAVCRHTGTPWCRRNVSPLGKCDRYRTRRQQPRPSWPPPAPPLHVASRAVPRDVGQTLKLCSTVTERQYASTLPDLPHGGRQQQGSAAPCRLNTSGAAACATCPPAVRCDAGHAVWHPVAQEQRECGSPACWTTGATFHRDRGGQLLRHDVKLHGRSNRLRLEVVTVEARCGLSTKRLMQSDGGSRCCIRGRRR